MGMYTEFHYNTELKRNVPESVIEILRYMLGKNKTKPKLPEHGLFGPKNDTALIRLSADAGIVIAAWGVHGEHLGRGDAVRRFLHRMHVLKLTKGGHPCHPLYLKADLKPKRWE